MGIKENWEKVDEVCPTCNQVTKQAKGITRQNIKRLFSFKMSYTEFLITFMLIMLLVLAYAYNSETKESREWIKEMQSGSLEMCKSSCGLKCDNIYQRPNMLTDSLNLSFKQNGYG